MSYETNVNWGVSSNDDGIRAGGKRQSRGLRDLLFVED